MKIYTLEESFDKNQILFILFLLIWYLDLLLDIFCDTAPAFWAVALFWMLGIFPAYQFAKWVSQVRVERKHHRECRKHVPKRGRIVQCSEHSIPVKWTVAGQKEMYEVTVQMDDGQEEEVTAFYRWPICFCLQSAEVDVYPDENGEYQIIDGFQVGTWSDSRFRELGIEVNFEPFCRGAYQRKWMIPFGIWTGLLLLVFFSRF